MPTDGSSSMTTSGCAATARPMSKRRCSASVSAAGRSSRFFDRPTNSRVSLASGLACGAASVPSRRVSSTVRWAKTRTSWKVRPIPACVRCSGRRCVTSMPPTRTVPDCVGSPPLATSISVVLPAPLPPIKATTSPSSTVRLTFDSARRPPKSCVTASISSGGAAERARSTRWNGASESSRRRHSRRGAVNRSAVDLPTMPSGSTAISTITSRPRITSRHVDTKSKNDGMYEV